MIAFLGDSHSAAVKRGGPKTPADWFVLRTNDAWPLVAILPDGAEAELDPEMVVRDAPIELGKYDRFVIIGLGLSLNRVVGQLYRKYRSERHAPATGVTILSAEAFDAAVLGLMRESLAVRLWRRLTDLTGLRVTLVPQPRLSEHIVLTDTGAVYRKIGPDAAELEASFERGLAALVADGVEIVDQPAETVKGHVFTAWPFCNADPEDPDPNSLFKRGDLIHMNATFGRLVLGQLGAA